MIVNQTAMNKQDIDFLNALLRKRPFLIILRILAFLLGTVWFLSGSAGLFFLIRDRDGKPSFWIYASLLFIGGLLLLLHVFFPRAIARRKSMKHPSLFAPRTYTFDEAGISAHHTYEGSDVTNRFVYPNTECCYAEAGTVYLRLHGEKKQKFYMCLHDDGYSAGSREELLRLLESKGIRIIQR